jgi:hypothetical protein
VRRPGAALVGCDLSQPGALREVRVENGCAGPPMAKAPTGPTHSKGRLCKREL